MNGAAGRTDASTLLRLRKPARSSAKGSGVGRAARETGPATVSTHAMRAANITAPKAGSAEAPFAGRSSMTTVSGA